MSEWVKVCATSDIAADDLIRFDHGGKTLCVYHTEKGFFATDGLCTHEDQHLEDGFIIGMEIECPLHLGRFNIETGQAMAAPVCVDLKTYPVKVEDGSIFVDMA